jgi:hypothetical protein
MSNNAIGEIRAIVGTACPDAERDYDGYKLWWKTLHDGYESFAMQAVRGSMSHEEKVESIREFSGIADEYLKQMPDWDLVRLRLARLSLYSRSYNNNRIAPSKEIYDNSNGYSTYGVGAKKTTYKASMGQHRIEFLARMGISNSLMEICCHPSMLDARPSEKVRQGIDENGIMIGLGGDEQMVVDVTVQYGSGYHGRQRDEIRCQIDVKSILDKDAQCAYQMPLTPFVDIWDVNGKNAREMYKIFGEQYYSCFEANGRLRRGKRWLQSSNFSKDGSHNAGFGNRESMLIISVVREGWAKQIIQDGSGRWYTPDYFLNDEGSNLSNFIDYSRNEDPNHPYNPQNRMDGVEFFSKNCKMITAIYDDNGFVGIVDGKCLDLQHDGDNRFYLDCGE